MHPLIRLLASVALVQLSVLAVQAAESPPNPPEQSRQSALESFVPAAPVPGDLEYLQGILKAYRDNDLPEAQILKTKLTQNGPAPVRSADAARMRCWQSADRHPRCAPTLQSSPRGPRPAGSPLPSP